MARRWLAGGWRRPPRNRDIIAAMVVAGPTELPVGPKRSGMALVAAALGVLGLVVALGFPAQFRLPRDFPPFEVLAAIFGIREVGGKAASLLAVFGVPAVAWGVVALLEIRHSRGALRGARFAVAGVVAGALLLLGSALFLVEPVSRRFEARYWATLLESIRGREADRDHGHVVHWANVRLGRLALRDGDVAAAKRYLLAAGRAPGSPALKSFDPDLELAQELLTRGEREVVIEYLRLCAGFWERPRLERWISVLAAGGTPRLDRYEPPAKDEPPKPGLARILEPKILEAQRFEDVLAYGPQGLASRRPEPGRTWLALLIEVAVPSAGAGLTFQEMTVADEAGAAQPAVGIGGPEPGGFRPKFLLLQEAFGPWRQDDVLPLSASPWSYAYQEGRRSEISYDFYSDRQQRLALFSITRAGSVRFVSKSTRLFLLFAPPANARQLELRFGTLARAVPALGPLRLDKLEADATAACERGDARACTTLGTGYEQSGPSDRPRAAVFYRKGCDLGHAEACGRIASLHQRGAAMPKDEAQAAALYVKACEGGDAGSCAHAAYRYLMGDGVVRDTARAVALYERGCQGADARACLNLGNAYMGGEAGLPRDFARAAVLYKRGCDVGSAEACGRLGYVHQTGSGVLSNDALAVELYERACRAGHAWSCASLGSMYLEGRGVSKNRQTATALYERACTGGEEWACTALKRLGR